MKYFTIISILVSGILFSQSALILTGVESDGHALLNWTYDSSLTIQGFIIFQDGESTCDEDEFTDCSHMCYPLELLSWVGDDFCDHNSYGPDFFCSEYDYDFGDCSPLFSSSQRMDNYSVPLRYYFENYIVAGASMDTTQLVETGAGHCYIVSTYLGTDQSPYEITVLQSSNPVCVGTCDAEPGGDLNGDSQVDVLDIIRFVQIILETSFPVVFEEYCAADMNTDTILNVLDVLLIVNTIID